MTYTLTVDPAAIREAAAIHAWREQEKKGSGERFLEALSACYNEIRERPFGHQIRRAPYRHAMIGWNSRLDELHAGLLRAVFLPRLADWTARRREIAARYLMGLTPLTMVRALVPPVGCHPCWHLFPVLTEPSRKQNLREWLAVRGIATGEHYPYLIPDQEALQSTPFVCYGSLETAKRLASSEISLPIHPYLTDTEVDEVLDALGSWRG